ncbi:hypothetical protein CfE428DRAFT_5690 [Chthoniobacter flavus Ellin428]|uniref:Uncharacterized protein n=1 Tax=Chthoniobacter flavus Ellin428 TaxID=497964 RepID=B4D9X3_9BACT|nr:hypothetical protein [Chthoniobacter flavus]EDY16727.1 hypothetical protein CfE428DRAFT_5690 [Chthoniobacter flavus Ellin428]TCO87844.1 hypothetical protein EV701_120143 [Chthoniobacter flavus]
MSRPRIDIQVPDQPFTTHTLEERYPHLSHTLIHKRVKEWLSGGKVKCIGKQQQEIAQQKAWFLYEPVCGSRSPESRADQLIAAGHN